MTYFGRAPKSAIVTRPGRAGRNARITMVNWRGSGEADLRFLDPRGAGFSPSRFSGKSQSWQACLGYPLWGGAYIVRSDPKRSLRSEVQPSEPTHNIHYVKWCSTEENLPFFPVFEDAAR